MHDQFISLNLIRKGLLSIVEAMEGLSKGPGTGGPSGPGASNPGPFWSAINFSRRISLISLRPVLAVATHLSST